MKKLAIFVEGQTEQIFVKKLLIEIIQEENIVIEEKKAYGGNKVNRVLTLLSRSESSDAKYFVMICDCGNDNRVKSDILDHYKNLEKNGYSMIIGIRDVYPIDRDKISLLKKALSYGVPTKGIKIEVILAIMEVESWFISDINHFSKIDHRLVPKYILEQLEIDLENLDCSTLNQPAVDLNRIYQLVSLSYNKNRKVVQNIIDVLDYSYIYLEMPKKDSQLKNLIDLLDTFFTPE